MEMQQSRYFYSDVQMRGFYPEYRLKKYEREGIVLQDTQEDYEVLKQYPCDFLSFSCYGSNTVTVHEDGLGTTGGNFSMGVKIRIWKPMHGDGLRTCMSAIGL